MAPLTLNGSGLKSCLYTHSSNSNGVSKGKELLDMTVEAGLQATVPMQEAAESRGQLPWGPLADGT